MRELLGFSLTFKDQFLNHFREFNWAILL